MDDAVLSHDVPRIENARLSEAFFELCAEFVQRYMALILKSAVQRRKHLAETRRCDGFSDGIGIYALDVRKDVLHQLGEG